MLWDLSNDGIYLWFAAVCCAVVWYGMVWYGMLCSAICPPGRQRQRQQDDPEGAMLWIFFAGNKGSIF